MSATSIPVQPSDITATWLTTVLQDHAPGVSVEDVTVKPVGTGQTGATYRVGVTYVTTGHGLPETFIVKLPSQDPEVRQRVAMGYRSEHAFYTEVVGTVHLPTPRCYHVEINDDGAEFVMVLDDLAPSIQGDQIKGCGTRDAELAVGALAGLHGPRWCDPRWLHFTGTVMPHPDADAANGIGDVTGMAVDTTLSRLGTRLAQKDRVTLAESAALVGDWLMVEPDRFCLLHGDYRLDNLLFHKDGTRVTVVDWQTLAVGLPARDLSYFIGTSMQPDVRGSSERHLVEVYHRALVGHGVEGFDVDGCWDDYVVGMLQIPLITTLGFAFSAATGRGDEMALVMLERGCRAIRELGTLKAIVQR